jgi:dUTP pyrophosphatase
MAKFEKVSKFADVDINLPQRKTAESAGYDMEVAEDIIIPSFYSHFARMRDEYALPTTVDLGNLATITKRLKTKPTLVSTGMKCKLDPGTYLELSVRSSCPLKHWLILANSVGIIDADYYNNPDNEGEIFFQMINLSPYDIQLHKGDIIGQGIIKPYLTTEDDNASGQRTGGFGSTSV